MNGRSDNSLLGMRPSSIVTASVLVKRMQYEHSWWDGTFELESVTGPAAAVTVAVGGQHRDNDKIWN